MATELLRIELQCNSDLSELQYSTAIDLRVRISRALKRVSAGLGNGGTVRNRATFFSPAIPGYRKVSALVVVSNSSSNVFLRGSCWVSLSCVSEVCANQSCALADER